MYGNSNFDRVRSWGVGVRGLVVLYSALMACEVWATDSLKILNNGSGVVAQSSVQVIWYNQSGSLFVWGVNGAAINPGQAYTVPIGSLSSAYSVGWRTVGCVRRWVCC